MLRRILSMLAAVLISAAVLVPQAHGAVFIPKPMNIFNTPKAAGGTVAQQYGLDNYVISILNNMGPGSVARIAAYDITDDRVADAVIAAVSAKRRVTVRVIVDKGDQLPEQRLMKALGNNVKANKSYAIACKYSCNSSFTSVMHAKIYLFSSTSWRGQKTASKISISGSQNLTHTNMSAAWNQSQVLTDPNIYAGYAKYFDQMRFDKSGAQFMTATSKGGKFKAYMWPSNTSSTDIFLTALKSIKNSQCVNVKGGYGNSQKRTVIRVNIFMATEARWAIFRELERLKKANCDVAVIYIKRPGAISQRILDGLWNAKVPTYNSRRDLNKDGLHEMHSHGKEMLINGMVFGRPNKVVWNGSGNFTGFALTRGNEQVLRTDDDYTYDAFKKNFDLIQKWSLLDRTRPVIVTPKVTQRQAPDSREPIEEAGESLDNL